MKISWRRDHSSRFSAETSVMPGGRLLEIWELSAHARDLVASTCTAGSQVLRTLLSSLLSRFGASEAAMAPGEGA